MRLETSLESSCELELASENELHLLLTHLSHILHSMHSGIVKLPKRESTHVTGISFPFGHSNRSNLRPAEFALSVLSSNHANTVITYRPPSSI